MSLPSASENNSRWSRKGRYIGGAQCISSDPRLKEATASTAKKQQPCSAFLLAFFVITAAFSALALTFDFSQVFLWGDKSASTASDLGGSTEGKGPYSFAAQKRLHKASATAKVQKTAAGHENRLKGGLTKDSITTAPLRSEGFQQLNEAPPRGVGAAKVLPRSWPYWPRPFGLNKFTVQTRAGREQQRLMGYVRENDDGDHDAAHVDSLGGDHKPGVGRPPAAPHRWYWPTEHSEAWATRWERVAFGTDDGAAAVAVGGDVSIEDGTVTPPLIPQLEKPWARRHVTKLMSKSMIAGIRTLAEAFIAYDERVKASLAVVDVRKDDALASIKARLAGIDYQPDIVPAYATMCGDNDCGVLPGHFSSFKTLGRFILVLNTADEGWVSLCRMLEEAFPDRFVVEYSMAKTLRLRAEQAEYKRRHNASDGVEELAMLYKERFGADPKDVVIGEVKAHFKDQDAADDVLDKTTDITTAYYRWHLRNLAPEQLNIPLGVYHSVAMGWNRILHICFRGDWPVDYVFIANGDFYLIRNSLARFAAHVFNVTRFGPERLRTLSAFQEGLPFSFFAHTYDAWRRFGEYDESIYPLYAEDNEFLLRIRSSGRELAAAYDEVYPKSKDFIHYRSMSQKGKRDDNTRLFINMIWDRRKEYLDAKYAAYSIKGAYVSPFMGALRSAYGSFPFNNSAISLRNSWAIDAKYRSCIFKPTDAERRACAPMDADVIQRLLTSGKII